MNPSLGKITFRTINVISFILPRLQLFLIKTLSVKVCFRQHQWNIMNPLLIMFIDFFKIISKFQIRVVHVSYEKMIEILAKQSISDKLLAFNGDLFQNTSSHMNE